MPKPICAHPIFRWHVVCSSNTNGNNASQYSSEFESTLFVLKYSLLPFFITLCFRDIFMKESHAATNSPFHELFMLSSTDCILNTFIQCILWYRINTFIREIGDTSVTSWSFFPFPALSPVFPVTWSFLILSMNQIFDSLLVLGFCIVFIVSISLISSLCF